MKRRDFLKTGRLTAGLVSAPNLVAPLMNGATAMQAAVSAPYDAFSEMDEQRRRFVELRFFAGLTIKDTSEVLGISPATVKRDRVTAPAWLHHAITGEPPA